MSVFLIEGKVCKWPWRCNQMAQPTVSTLAEIRELRNPYSLEFTLFFLEEQKECQRIITMSDISNLLKLTRTNDFPSWHTLGKLGKNVDRAIDTWILRGKTPQCQDLALWLLHRMVLMEIKNPKFMDFQLVLFGEMGADKPHSEENDISEINEEKQNETFFSHHHLNKENMEALQLRNKLDDLQSRNDISNDMNDLVARFSIEEDDIDKLPPEYTSRIKSQINDKASEHEKIPLSKNTPSESHDVGNVQKENAKPKFRNGNGTFAFEPEVVRNQRKTAMGRRLGWSTDRARITIELHRSQSELKQLKEIQRRSDVIQKTRLEALLKNGTASRRRTLKMDKDAKFVKEATRDAIEYQALVKDMEDEILKVDIASKREQERWAKTMQIGARNKWMKGPYLGPGPLPPEATSALRGAPSDLIYDLHGRKHSKHYADEVAALSSVNSALEKIKRAALTKTVNGVDLLQVFRKYDTNPPNNLLDKNEFHHALIDLGIRLTGEQLDCLFSHFDPNKSGNIDYGEFMWGFFNRQAFIKKWKMKQQGLSSTQVLSLFHRYDQTGRGALSTKDFFLLLNKLGITLSPLERNLLFDRFDHDKDGFIAYHEFTDFINSRNSDENKC